MVWRKGTRPNGEEQELAWAEDSDIELVFAEAHVQLKKWLRNNEGGY